MKKTNSIDSLIEKMAKEFSMIKNFHLLQEEPVGQRLFTFIIKYISEINAFKSLFIHYYLPAAIKSSQDYSRELKFSKYRNQIQITTDELKENYYETIRLGYVGIYHKYEAYLKDIILLMDDFFDELYKELSEYQKIESYLKSEFNIELRKTINNFYTTEKINWISNCVKHYDGFPIKEPIFRYYKYTDRNIKIRIESKEFKEGIDSLLSHNQLILSALFFVGFHQYISQEFSLIKSELSEGKTKDDVEFLKSKIKELIKVTFNVT